MLCGAGCPAIAAQIAERPITAAPKALIACIREIVQQFSPAWLCEFPSAATPTGIGRNDGIAYFIDSPHRRGSRVRIGEPRPPEVPRPCPVSRNLTLSEASSLSTWPDHALHVGGSRSPLKSERQGSKVVQRGEPIFSIACRIRSPRKLSSRFSLCRFESRDAAGLPDEESSKGVHGGPPVPRKRGSAPWLYAISGGRSRPQLIHEHIILTLNR